MVKLTEINYGPWKESNSPPRHCWDEKSLRRGYKSNGYIFFSLSHSPEFHASQIANAVVVARHLGATLALPDIRGINPGEIRQFADFYDVEKFTTSLSGAVDIDKNPPLGISTENLPVVRVPNRVSKDFVASNIEPIFRSKRNLKLVTYFNASMITNGNNMDKLSNAYRCQAMFESLKLQGELQELVDTMVGTLRSLSQKMRGRFIALDLQAEMLAKKSCQLENDDAANKRCYNAAETGEFLKRIGFDKDTTVYITQTGWHSSLDSLRDIFPNTFTKDAIMPIVEKARFLDANGVGYERLIDHYMCAQGDVFVAAYPSRFYESVVGDRIGRGNTQVFVPAASGSGLATNYVSPYVAKKRHPAYSCFC
ncbi:protein MANNAN SYNTHESIS-RELATED 2-like isoform X2 [Andrographis paniculata]|nr:protein MANNAN SYNTHESIS-RELATED 2-like isoform X2 [Andrographis paniculata]